MHTLKKSTRNKSTWIIATLLTAAMATLAWNGSQAQANRNDDSIASVLELNKAFTQISEDASQAVVFIQAEKEAPRRVRSSQRPLGQNELGRQFFGRQLDPAAPEESRQPMVMGQGTGFIITPDGYIVTNNHVVADADRVLVKRSDGKEYIAEVIGSDPATEIALIKVDAQDLPIIPLGNSDAIKVGEWALAIGNPFGLSHTVTAGIISAKGRGNVGITDYANFIQTDAAINPGNSGGPLLDIHGNAIGLNTAIFSRSSGNVGIGFAIPINMVKHITDQLIDTGSITRGYLGIGIQNITQELADWFKLDNGHGILVATVQEGSPAAVAGLQRDDVILKFGNQSADEIGSFRSRVSTTTPGEEVPVVIVRDGKEQTLKVTIGTLDNEKLAAGSDAASDMLGVIVGDMTPDQARILGFSHTNAVVVNQVQTGSVAFRAGIRPGNVILEVNRQPVQSAGEFHEALNAATEGRATLLLVQDERSTHYVVIGH